MKIDDHRRALRDLEDWMPYLTRHSGLPGPRGNLELVAACGEEANLRRARALVKTGDEFATVCGLVALGRLFGSGDERHVATLHQFASDARWRVREGVAMALQRAGDTDRSRLFAVARRWADDPDPLVQRAAIAAVAEPRLIAGAKDAQRALDIVDRVTRSLAAWPPTQRRDAAVRTLRQALGYCWSVVVAARPDDGLRRFRALDTRDADIAWIVRENNKKARLRRLLPP